MNVRTPVIAAMLAGAALVAAAQVALAPKTLRALGGEYSQQCSDPASLRAFVEAKSLTLRYRGKSVSSAAPRETPSYFAAGKAPPDFAAALVGEVTGAGRLAFVFLRPKGGTEMMIDAEPAVLERVGLLRLSQMRFRRCGSA
jgi:hypothetical protein